MSVFAPVVDNAVKYCVSDVELRMFVSAFKFDAISVSTVSTDVELIVRLFVVSVEVP